MTDRSKLLALAEAVEKLTEGSRNIDWEIEDAVGGGRFALRYTASLDAAMTLVPEGWSTKLCLSEGGLYPCVVLGRSYPTNAIVPLEGHTLPVTLCAAALRAQAEALS